MVLDAAGLVRSCSEVVFGKFLDGAADDRLYALYMLAVDSGMRQGELLALHWPDVDFAGSSVSVRQSLEEIGSNLRLKEVKTRRSRRKIELTAATMDALNQHRRDMLAEGQDLKSGTVFCNADGSLIRKHVVYAEFLKLAAAAAVPRIEFKGMRHTCATLLLLANVNPKIVSERLGHSSIQITLDTYSHVLPTMQSKATGALDSILRRRHS